MEWLEATEGQMWLRADLRVDADDEVSAKLCDGGHVCTFPKECCSLGCCSYSTFPQIGNSVTEMFKFLFWYYWYLWIAVFAGLIIAAACGCWLCRRRHANMMEDGTISDRASTGSCYLPPHYSRCSSIVQAMPPPYNEVTAKPDLYPLVIGYDDGFGKGASGLVMRYFRSLSHASTLDSLSSSFMCNVVNEANTIIPPPYSCNNSVDELSTVGAGSGAAALGGGAVGGARERPTNFGEGSLASLANHRTTSDVSSLAAQSPLSPPRATSPTIEIPSESLRELLDKIQQLPQLPASQQNRPQALFSLGLGHRSSSPPADEQLLPSSTYSSQATSSSGQQRTKRTRGKTYVSVGPPPQRSTKSARSWLSRSAPTTPSGPINPVAAFLPGGHHHHHHHHHHHVDPGSRQQAVPLLLAEQDENEHGNGAPEIV
ncbi:SH3 and multiple ankyrin repeat domains protein 1 isoform X2 [Nasonia vitripennis]|uniref:WW domain binding protein VOPP1 n=1 Tax=Nasonia vitripennis TaxID=7425 RepID=A0A7M7IUY5_NASVI|nr:SH3 and multiple ankyrin repeat domains protein 1 isoform X2 [Nasonia vitripennis]